MSTKSDARHGIVTQIAHGECLGVDPPLFGGDTGNAQPNIELRCWVLGKEVSLSKLDEWGEKPRESVTVMLHLSFECGEGSG